MKLGLLLLKRLRRKTAPRPKSDAKTLGRWTGTLSSARAGSRFPPTSSKPTIKSKGKKKPRRKQTGPKTQPLALLDSFIKSGQELTGPTSSTPQLMTDALLRPEGELRQSIEAFLLDQRSPHTRKAYGKDLKRFVRFLPGRKLQVGAEQLTRGVLIGYKEYLLSEKLEHTTVDRHLASLKSFFRWLVEDGVLTKSPADGVRFLNPRKVSTTIGLTDEEVRKILAQPDLHSRAGAQHYAILMILFFCGLRRSELCELRTRQIVRERNRPIVKLRGKGNVERVLVLTDPVWNSIQYCYRISRKRLDVDQYLFSPLRNNRTGEMNKPLDSSAIFYLVRKYAKQAGIQSRISPHSCRATAISNARDHNVPDRAIQEFAGWASPDMITRYDKRKNSLENSAAYSIEYGNEDRVTEAEKRAGIPQEPSKG